MSSHQIRVKAYAKLNLTLEVLQRRPDQYHEVRSVVQTISLADEMTLQVAQASGTMLRVQGYPVPTGDDNLVMVALRLVAARLGVSRDLEIRLIKNIPPGRGMGGGSSDAAAILCALGYLHGWSMDREGLYGVAAETGSDVPLFLKGGLLLVSGRGEKTERSTTPSPDYAIAVAWPSVSVPTEMAYGLLEPQDFSEGAATMRLWEQLCAGNPPAPELLTNCFERVVFERWAPVAALHARMSELAGVPARMTGSGSALFALTENAPAVVEQLWAEGYEAVVAHPVNQGQDIVGDEKEGEACA